MSATADLRDVADEAPSLRHGTSMQYSSSPMSVERLIATSDHVCTVLRSTAAELRKSGAYDDDAALLETAAKALEVAKRDALASPPDETPPEGAYLAAIQSDLETPYAHFTPGAARWVVHRLREGRALMRKLLASAEICGEADLVSASQKWIEIVDAGPPRPDR